MFQRIILAFLLLGFGEASASTWTYRLRVIDESKYDSLKGRKLKLSDLEAVTAIREVTVQNPKELNGAPTLEYAPFVVCLDKCDRQGDFAKPSRIEASVAEFVYPVNSAEFRQVNVFYHLLRSWDGFRALGYVPSFRKPVPVRIDRHVEQLLYKGEMSNNAFFDTEDNSLNFVPAKTVIYLGGLVRTDYLDTAYDPVVVAHELTHLVLHDAVGRVENSDFSALHEAMADFFSLSFYKTSSLGVIFGAGKPFRSAIGKESYQVGAEAHQRGLVFLQALDDLESALTPRRSIVKSVYRSWSCLERSVFGSFNFAMDCALKQLQADYPRELGETELARLESQLKKTRGIEPSRFREAPAPPSSRGETTGFVEYKLVRSEGTSSSTGGSESRFIRIEGYPVKDDYAYYRVQIKEQEKAPYGPDTLVLVDLKSNQVYRSWSTSGAEVTPQSVLRFPYARKNASVLQKKIETEVSKLRSLTKLESSAFLRKRETECIVQDRSIPCTELTFMPSINPVLKMIGLNLRVNSGKITVLRDEGTLIAPFSVIRLNTDLSFGEGAQAPRLVASEELKSFSSDPN